MTGKAPYLLAIDQGTTSTRAILFDADAVPVRSHGIELRQSYPQNGWVEHDAVEIWRAVCVCAGCVLDGIARQDVLALGIANQRETVVVWDRKTSEPIHRAIVWQDRRTAAQCAALKEQGAEADIVARTGLLIDPYFSASKIAWLLDHVPGARARAEKGELCAGTIDSWLIWKLTGGRAHTTDVTNASRTQLLNLSSLEWDGEMLRLFGVPLAMLPQLRDSAGVGDVAANPEFPMKLPVMGVAGDQQAALVGQACLKPGDVKSTYGTGCFALVNTGTAIPTSRNRLLATAGYRAMGETAYALEGSIFVAGAAVQWLRDSLGVIASAAESETLAKRAKAADGLYFVPAFTGLGAPYWDPHARGAIVGLTRDAGAAEITRAALDAVCYQTRDLLAAMARDLGASNAHGPSAIKVDGGMVANDWFCQRLADLTGLPIERPKVTETTALGAAYLAGLGAGLFGDLSAIAKGWALDRRFEPELGVALREALYEGWSRAVARVRG